MKAAIGNNISVGVLPFSTRFLYTKSAEVEETVIFSIEKETRQQDNNYHQHISE